MKSTAAKSATTDDIDRIVDGLLADPSRADDVKGALRSRLAAGAATPVRTLEKAPRTRPSHDEDDMWENVPI